MHRPKNPILADYFLDAIEQSQKRLKLSEPETGAIKEVLKDAYRYVFPQRTTDMAEEAVKAPRKLAPFITLPAKWVWVEFVNPAEGVLINANDDLRRGQAIYVEGSPRGKGMSLSIAAAVFNLDEGGFFMSDDFAIPDVSKHIPERFQKRFMGAIVLLGAPDLLERRAVQHSRKWNEAREARGDMVWQDHEVIQLHLTRYEKDQEREWSEQREKHEGTGGRKRHHFVRAHIRITERGKVSKVSPHFRGDPALGEAPKTHIVRP
jgi:hypothetical protein